MSFESFLFQQSTKCMYIWQQVNDACWWLINNAKVMGYFLSELVWVYNLHVLTHSGLFYQLLLVKLAVSDNLHSLKDHCAVLFISFVYYKKKDGEIFLIIVIIILLILNVKLNYFFYFFRVISEKIKQKRTIMIKICTIKYLNLFTGRSMT